MADQQKENSALLEKRVAELEATVSRLERELDRLSRKQSDFRVSYCSECGTYHQAGQCRVSSRR